MKKIFIVFLVMVLVVGCGGSSSNQKSPKYTYKWSTGSSVSTSGITTMNNNETEEEPEEPSPIYKGTVVPPYASVRYPTSETVGTVSIYTYLDGVPVRSNYVVDPADGTIDVTGVNNDIDYFKPIKTGIISIAASYDEYTLTIPVHVYWAYKYDGLIYLDFDTMTVYPTGANPAVDVLLGGTNFKAPYGYLTVPDAFISTVASAPSGSYRKLGFDQEYWAGYFDNVVTGITIIKTSEGRYVKLRYMSWGYDGTTFCFWVSDTNGVFSH